MLAAGNPAGKGKRAPAHTPLRRGPRAAKLRHQSTHGNRAAVPDSRTGAVTMSAARIAKGILDLLLPPSCLSCGSLVRADAGAGLRPLCDACRDELSALVSQAACARCGHSVGPYATCSLCLDASPPFAAAVRIGLYDGPLARLVQVVKYRGVRCGAPLLADMLLAKLHQARVADQVDAVAAVPLHWWRFYRRGYNQAALLARALRARGLAAPLVRPLVRTRDTRPQVGLSRRARLENVRGAFRVRRPEAVRGRRFLLVDDVMTTGATAGTCARELLRAGARSVAVAVAAVAEGGRQTMAS